MTSPVVADVASGLIGWLRRELGDPVLGFAEPPQPLGGGFDTRIFAFRLNAAPPAAAGPLILRVLSPHHDRARALRERATQNALLELGYRAPRVLWASIDTRWLGGAFVIMERLPGMPLLHGLRLGIASALSGLQARLHALDPEPLLAALDREGVPRIGRASATFEAYLDAIERRIDDGQLDGLRPAIWWLVAHRPRDRSSAVICHGDFHPQNVLAQGRVVTGVVDWPNALVEAPECDVASTLVILRYTPIDLLGFPAPLRWIARAAQRRLVQRYLAGYQRRRPLDPVALSYYEAASCLRAMVRAAEQRSRPGVTNSLDASPFAERLAARFAHLTGVVPVLPPVRR